MKNYPSYILKDCCVSKWDLNCIFIEKYVLIITEPSTSLEISAFYILMLLLLLVRFCTVNITGKWILIMYPILWKPDSMKHRLESRLQGEISVTSDMHMTLPHGRKQRGTKDPLDESEREEWKSWLKTQHSKKTTRSWHLVPSLHGK